NRATGQHSRRSRSANKSAHIGSSPARRAENAAARVLAPTMSSGAPISWDRLVKVATLENMRVRLRNFSIAGLLGVYDKGPAPMQARRAVLASRANRTQVHREVWMDLYRPLEPCPGARRPRLARALPNPSPISTHRNRVRLIRD